MSVLTRIGSNVAMAFTMAACLSLTALPCMGRGTWGAQPGLSLVEQKAQPEWNTYTSLEHQFTIGYPPNWVVEETPHTRIAGGAVATFIPAQDPSLDALGVKTNLFSVSVTVAMPAAGRMGPEIDLATGDLPAHQLADAPQRLHFLQSFSSEGAVGNRYETATFATSFAGRRYEIILSVHSANPGCYPAGTVAIFDAAKLEQLFATMVGTFRLAVASMRFWIE